MRSMFIVIPALAAALLASGMPAGASARRHWPSRPGRPSQPGQPG